MVYLMVVWHLVLGHSIPEGFVQVGGMCDRAVDRPQMGLMVGLRVAWYYL